MKTLLTILLFVGLVKSSFGCCASDDKTLTEKLFTGETGTIFTCKILTMTIPDYDNNIIVERSDGSIEGKATAKIIQVYFGQVDTNIISLNTGSHLQIGQTYLIYTNGKGKIFSFGGSCDRWSKQIDDNLTHEVQLLKIFSDIFKNKTTDNFIFKNSQGIIIAEGKFKNGKPINNWRHYYENGIIKAEYDLENNVTSQFSKNGYINQKLTVNKNVSVFQQYSTTINGQLRYEDIETKSDTGLLMQVYEYYDNGFLKNVHGQIILNLKSGNTTTDKTGTYEEYYENSKLKLKGQYNRNRRVGFWKWYFEDGKFNTEFDYKDGTGPQ